MQYDNLSNLDALAYLRKSRKDVEEEKRQAEIGNHFDTLDRHKQQLLEFAKFKNINIIDILYEVESGEYISERPEMQKLLRRVENGEVDAVLCMDLDRLGRGDMVDQGTIYRIFRNSQTIIVTPTEVIDPQDENQELTFSIKSLIAREELKAITKRMQRGRRQSAKEGKSISKKPPYGYIRDENLKLHPDPEKAWIVKMIFEKSAAGMGRRMIAEELDRLKIDPPNIEYWDPTTVSAILENEAYLGKIIWGKVKYTKINGKYVRRKMPREQWQITENAHEPIVSDDLFNNANNAMKARWTPHVRNDKKLMNPLAGILYCELCNKSMIAQPRPDRSDSHVRCYSHQCKGIQKGVNLKVIEGKILLSLEELTKEFELPEAVQKKIKSSIKLKEKALNKLYKEKTEINKQNDNIHDLLEKGIYDIQTFLERQHVIKEKISSLEDNINEIELEIAHDKKLNDSKTNYAPKVKNVLEAYRATVDIDKKNVLLKSIIDKVTYIRKKEWMKKGQFEIKIYSKI